MKATIILGSGTLGGAQPVTLEGSPEDIAAVLCGLDGRPRLNALPHFQDPFAQFNGGHAQGCPGSPGLKGICTCANTKSQAQGYGNP